MKHAIGFVSSTISYTAAFEEANIGGSDVNAHGGFVLVPGFRR